MPTALRVFPGLTALTLSFLSAYLFATHLGLIFNAASNPQFFFTVSHIGSALLCVSVPIAFLLVGQYTNCQPKRLKVGTILLAIAAAPLLIANGMYLFVLQTPQGADGAIGAILLMLLGALALLITSLVFIFALPTAHSVDADRLDNKHGHSRR